MLDVILRILSYLNTDVWCNVALQNFQPQFFWFSSAYGVMRTKWVSDMIKSIRLDFEITRDWIAIYLLLQARQVVSYQSFHPISSNYGINQGWERKREGTYQR